MVSEENAARFRQRAEKLRSIAAGEANRQNRELLEQVACEYDEIALEAEILAKQSTDDDIFVGEVRSAGDLAGVFEYDHPTGYFYLCRTGSPDHERTILGIIRVPVGPTDFCDGGISVRWDSSESKVGLFLKGTLLAAFEADGKKYGGDYLSDGHPLVPEDVTRVFRCRDT